MRVERSCTQILFGHLPHQTVDIKGRVWKVIEWVKPHRLEIDQETLRRALERQASAWERTGQDGNFVHVNGGGKVQRGAGAERRPKWATPLV
jgi:hypothetical protein